MERITGADDPQQNMENRDARPWPDAAMARRALVHEAVFVVVAAALNRPDWVMRMERDRGASGMSTIIGEPPRCLTENQSIRQIVAPPDPVIAQCHKSAAAQRSASAQREAMGLASVGQPPW